MRLVIPEPSLVLLIGPSGAGKSTFARAHFGPAEILSSDQLRGILADDPDDQSASGEAFHVLSLLLNGRLRRRLLTVVDATNLRAVNRRRWLGIARRYGIVAVAVVFDLPADVYEAHNRQRPDRQVEDEVVRNQVSRMATAVEALPYEGYWAVYRLTGPSGDGEVEVHRVPETVR